MFKSKFDKLLNTATSNFPLGPDWKSTLQICEIIRQKDVKPKFALNAISKKLSSNIPHIALGSLLVMECCIINCGKLVYEEFATKSFMEQMGHVIRTTPYEIVKNKLLDLLQRLGFAFQIIPKYCAVQDMVDILKAEGYTFPTSNISYYPTFSSDVLVVPDHCYQCRVKFGIVKPLVVCGACFEMSRQPQTNKGSEKLPAQQNSAENRKTEEELREDEELQLALALSQSEIEQQQVSTELYSATPVKEEKIEAESDPELARYLDRSYWDYRTEQNTKHAELNNTLKNTSETNNPQNLVIRTAVINQQSEDTEEMETQLITVKSQLDIFVNRIKSNLNRGRTIINDEALETFYSTITPTHQKLLQYIQQQDEKRLFFERLQDKMVQVKDIRAALDAVRDDHKAAFQKEADFAKKQRQLQLELKLDILRQRKKQYQWYQHQITLQQVQKQEQEMTMRKEHQLQSYINNSMYDPSSLSSVPIASTPYTELDPNLLMSSQVPENRLRYPQLVDSCHFQHKTQLQDFVDGHIPQNPVTNIIIQPINVPFNEPDNFPPANPNNTQPIHQPQMIPMTGPINSEAPVSLPTISIHEHSYPSVHPQDELLKPSLQQPPMSNKGPQLQDFVRIHMIAEKPSTIPIDQPVILSSNEPIIFTQANPNNTQSIHQTLMTPMIGPINSEAPIISSTTPLHQHSCPSVNSQEQLLIPGLQQPQMSNKSPQPQDFVRIHMIPENPSTISINQPVILPSDEPINLTQANPYNTQSIHQPLMTPMTSPINKETPINSLANSMHQQSYPDVDIQEQPLIPGLQQPIPSMSLQHHTPAGQPMMPRQHQQLMMGQTFVMTYGGPVHMQQYDNQPISSQQDNLQSSVPNQTEQPKVEQPEVADLINFD